jgi:hypothetical protein
MAKTYMIGTAPKGWTNVAPFDDPNYPANISTCISLITGSSPISAGMTAADLMNNIAHVRTALWLRTSDSKIAIIFHSLDGPTSDPLRCPKFCVCVGVDESIAIPDPCKTTDEPYKSIRAAVIEFTAKNVNTGRCYLWVATGSPLTSGNILPLLNCAITYDLDGDDSKGTVETYPSSSAKPRWQTSLTTWRLKSS